MKLFNDSHLEVKRNFDGKFETHPYECGWADEAIFFIMVEKTTGAPRMKVRVQLSQDGVHWADDNTPEAMVEGEGLHPLKVAPNFGNYLRFKAEIEGGEMFLNVHIACKG